MKKHEILSPVGDEKTFYTAIKCGADAVYMGLPKFNARMKADNITIDKLGGLVSFAHLKGVKVYITLNTILSSKEIVEVQDLVGECLKCGIDAFIVQDLGLIYALKKVYPNIVLHGSTQLGVHNVRGARVAKQLGLTRVVLSREATITDIREIAKNVDIELEVFVQGAMCVGFSGNCYFSSLKCGASGNRGECKQLCRLPYTLSDGKKNLTGYVLSPRDNCMVEYLHELCKIGVCSFKIEGRLRHSGYVGVATNCYRELLDSISNHQSINIPNVISRLKKVFARGEYITGYNESNNIIDYRNNNHIGERIGIVKKCERFKDIYKVTINSKEPIVSGDGLKFVYNNQTTSIGVGNIEKTDKNTIIYTKNNIHIDSIVYKSLDSQFESKICDYSQKRKLNIKCGALCGNKLMVEYSVDDIKVTVYGEICEPAKNAPLTEENFIKSLTKVDKEIFDIGDIDVITDGVFVVVSALNDLRRRAIDNLYQKLLAVPQVTRNDIENVSPIIDCRYGAIALINEECDVSLVAKKYDACIYSPIIYSVENIRKFLNVYQKYFSTPLIINLPIIARIDDISIIDDIVETFKDRCEFVANNIYALDYIGSGAKLLAGWGLNIMNEKSASLCQSLGVSEIIKSIEKWNSGLSAGYKMAGKNVLMTMTACPFKTMYGGECSSCKYSRKLILNSNNSSYFIRRYKVANCYFELVDNNVLSANGNIIEDVRK